MLTFAKVVDGKVVQKLGFADTKAWEAWAKDNPYYFEKGPTEWLPEIDKRTGYKLAAAAKAGDPKDAATRFLRHLLGPAGPGFMGYSYGDLENTNVTTINIVISRWGYR